MDERNLKYIDTHRYIYDMNLQASDEITVTLGYLLIEMLEMFNDKLLSMYTYSPTRLIVVINCN